MQRYLKTILGYSAAGVMLTACLEAQPAPEIPQTESSAFAITVIADGLSSPWSITPLPGTGQSYLVTERGGKLLRVGPNGKKAEVSGLPSPIYAEQQAGLFDVVLAPDFPDSGEVFLAYAYGDAAANGTALYKAVLRGNTLQGGETIFRADAKDTANHYGGRIVFLPDDTLILTGGDGFVYREKAQDKKSLLGKIYRLDRFGKALSDNPFAADPDARAEIYSYGHRNVQGLHFDGRTGDLWAHEHGPRGGDELNLIKPGKNYGWPLTTTGTDYNGAKVTPFETYAGTQSFVKDWTPSIAPSGLTIYRGGMFPDWNGDALIGGLASRDLRRVDLENGNAVGEESLLADLDGRIRDVRVDSGGAVLLIIDDETQGQVLRITPKP